MLTEVFEDRDYIEWHRGIKEYGFWCFKITNPSWLNQIKGLQNALATHLLEDYLRFPHITVSTVGLMNVSNWKLVEKQASKLATSNLTPIRAFWNEASSYQHVPIIRVGVLNHSTHLNQIRKLLHSVTYGDDTEVYDPHITYCSSNTSITAL